MRFPSDLKADFAESNDPKNMASRIVGDGCRVSVTGFELRFGASSCLCAPIEVAESSEDEENGKISN